MLLISNQKVRVKRERIIDRVNYTVKIRNFTEGLFDSCVVTIFVDETALRPALGNHKGPRHRVTVAVDIVSERCPR